MKKIILSMALATSLTFPSVSYAGNKDKVGVAIGVGILTGIIAGAIIAENNRHKHHVVCTTRKVRNVWNPYTKRYEPVYMEFCR